MSYELTPDPRHCSVHQCTDTCYSYESVEGFFGICCEIIAPQGAALPPEPCTASDEPRCVLAHIGMVNGRGRCVGRKGSRLEEGGAACPTSRPQTPPKCTA